MSIPIKSVLSKQVLFLVLALSYSVLSFAQEEKKTQIDSTEQKKERKARNSFKISAGLDFNNLNLDSADEVESNSRLGYNLGVSFKSGRFFYYEVGARYNKRNFKVTDISGPIEVNRFSTSSIEVPLNVGVNLTSFASRLIGVRIFVGAVPSFLLNADADEMGLEKDDFTSFLFLGQAGVGIDIAFFFVETGYNYGLSNVLKDVENESVKSNPSQFFINLGARF